jgi:AbrB family looped-hinge helix DNA binding protein
MATTKMTRKGQVTIPVDIREKLGLKEGDRFVVREVDGKVVLENARESLQNAIEAIRLHANTLPPLTPDEMDEVIAEAIVDDYLESIADR